MGSRRGTLTSDELPLSGEKQSQLYFVWNRKLKDSGLSSERRSMHARLLAHHEVPEDVLSDVSGPGIVVLDHETLKSIGVSLAIDRMVS